MAENLKFRIDNFKSLHETARRIGPKRIAVVMADDEVILAALMQAISLGMASAVLIGSRAKIERKLAQISGQISHRSIEFIEEADSSQAVLQAVDLARQGRVDIILKGHIRTDQLLRAVIDKDRGLRTGRLMSDVLLYEDTVSGEARLVGVSDGGINILPTLLQKVEIIKNAVSVMHILGFQRPRIALLSATEAVSEALPSSVEARLLTQQAELHGFGACEVFGPLALDNAILLSAAVAKGITSPVAGYADVMIVPNIEAGNILGKAVKYFAGSQCAHIVTGAKIPVLIPSRVESIEDKINSIALGVLMHG